MPGGHSLFGTRASASQGPRPHSAAQFAGTNWLFNAGGSAFFPHGPKDLTLAFWVRLASKGTFQRLVSIGRNAGTGPTGDILGVQYDPGTDQFVGFASNGTAYTTVSPVPAANPVLGSWYLVVAEFGGTLQISVTSPAGVQVGGSVAFAGPYNPTANRNVGVGATPDGIITLAAGGAVDSVQVWNDVNQGDFPLYFGAPGAIWNGGKALDFNELPATAPPAAKCQLYLNFNEPTGTGQYRDASPNALSCLTSGAGAILRIAGAGY